MKAIKDTLRASKLARSIPNNILVSSPTISKLKGRDWDIHTERGMKGVGCVIEEKAGRAEPGALMVYGSLLIPNPLTVDN